MTAAPWSGDLALDALLEALDEGVLVFDEAGNCRAIGRRAAVLLGIDRAKAIGLARPEILRRAAAATDAPAPILALANPEQGTELAATVEIRGPAKATIVWTSVPLTKEGRRVGRVDVVRDVSSERRAEEAVRDLERRIEEVSAVDALTGLSTRRRFEQESDREHRRAQRAWDSYSIARIDIDGMSQVNKTHGHDKGDEILRNLAEELRSARREYDIVARWDGDEFIVLLPGADGRAARTVVKRAVTGMMERARAVTSTEDVTVCAGAAVWIPPSSEVAEDIIRRAGTALDEARAKGPRTIRIDAGEGQWKDEPTGG